MKTIVTKSHDACGEPATRVVTDEQAKLFARLARLNRQCGAYVTQMLDAEDAGLTPEEFFAQGHKNPVAKMAPLQRTLIEQGFSKWDVRTVWTVRRA